MRSVLSTAATVSLMATSALAATYTVTDTYTDDTFLDMFDFEAITDPSDGRVNYVDKSDAESLGLAYAYNGNWVLRADNTTTLTSSDAGRNSFRVQSVNTYGANHVSVFSILHMPAGCSMWPAVWELGPDWPDGGEVDIVEGVNDVPPNQSTLHTLPGCTMPASVTQTGTTISTDCNTADNSNQGCAVAMATDNSFGSDFNSNGGGWYAMERTDDFIKVWFWAATDTSVPSDVSGASDSIDTDNWGTASAYFPNTDCDIDSYFEDAWIIINLTFCGDWAGQPSIYSEDGCSGTCEDYVNENPSAFTEAYFEFEWIRVYEA